MKKIEHGSKAAVCRSQILHTAYRLLFSALFLLLIFFCPQNSAYCMYRQGLRNEKPCYFTPFRAVKISGSKARAVSRTNGCHTLFTQSGRFRILWGDNYDRSDSEWNDTDSDGIPEWVEIIADAIEKAYSVQSGFGFPDPYGMNKYALDVYIGNTGIKINDNEINIDSSYYGFTDINNNDGAAYFVFNDDFSGIAGPEREKDVLKVTVAHELFHAVQRVNYPWDDETAVPDSRWQKEEWWFEATATWMEELCQPDVNDYIQYVKDFLAHPEISLMEADGFREYGAALFPAYLWMCHGDSGLWQTVFHRAYDQGVEKAIEEALAEQEAPTLAETIAEFWSLAAHPQDLWQDGSYFYNGTSPAILETISVLPDIVSPSFGKNPERFGANIYLLENCSGFIAIDFKNTDLAWKAGFSKTGESKAVYADPGESFSIISEREKNAYISIINVSAESGASCYSAELKQAESSSEADNGGGCFIKDLRF